MTGMLASVNCIDEALLVLNAGVDIIDLKQPAQGALGALDNKLIAQIVKLIGGQRPVSATIGDLPMQANLIADAAKNMATTGVDYIKIGFFPGGDWHETIKQLTVFAGQGIKIIVVLFADTQPDLDILTQLAKAGLSGVMLDTMDKQQGSLTTMMSKWDIEQFVIACKHHHLLCGLAGSLKEQDIANLLSLRPDYLGFRGALCSQHLRTSTLDADAVLRIKADIRYQRTHHAAAVSTAGSCGLTLNAAHPHLPIKT